MGVSEAQAGLGTHWLHPPVPDQPWVKPNRTSFDFPTENTKPFLTSQTLLAPRWPCRECSFILRSGPPQKEQVAPGDPGAGLTVAGHAQCQAFLQAAVLAAVAVGAVDQAVPLPGAGVAGIVLLAPPKETLPGMGREELGKCPAGSQGRPPARSRPPRAHLAAFAGDDTVVDPGGFVSADLARDHLNLGCDG